MLNPIVEAYITKLHDELTSYAEEECSQGGVRHLWNEAEFRAELAAEREAFFSNVPDESLKCEQAGHCIACA